MTASKTRPSKAKEPSPTMKLLRERIDERCATLDISYNAASERAGMDRSMLGKFMRGETQELGYDRVLALAPILKTSEDYLLGKTNHAGPTGTAGSALSSTDVPIVGITETNAFRPDGWVESQKLGVLVNAMVPAFKDQPQFAYLVRGNDMIGAGIIDGGAVVCVDPWTGGAHLSSGDIVVVQHRAGTVSEYTDVARREDIVVVQHRAGTVSEYTVRELLIDQKGIVLMSYPSGSHGESIRLPADADLQQGERRVIGIMAQTLRRMEIRRGVQAAVPAAPASSARSTHRADVLVSGLATSALMATFEAYMHAYHMLDYVLA